MLKVDVVENSMFEYKVEENQFDYRSGTREATGLIRMIDQKVYRKKKRNKSIS